MRIANKTSFGLITLYSATQRVRESASRREDRLANNRFLDTKRPASHDSPGHECEPNPSVKELCRVVDGFVYVVDATEDYSQIGGSCVAELHAMLNTEWTGVRAPLVVLSCVCDEGVANTTSCFDLIDVLQLRTLGRQWQVNSDLLLYCRLIHELLVSYSEQLEKM